MVRVLHGTIGIQHAAMSIYQAYHDRTPILHDRGTRRSASLQAHSATTWPAWSQLHEVGCAAEDAGGIADGSAGSLPPSNHAADGPDAGRARHRASERRSRRSEGAEVHAAANRRRRCRRRAREIATALLDAQNPRIAVGRLRTPQGVKLAVELAELVGASTSTRATSGPMSFPQRHPLCGPGATRLTTTRWVSKPAARKSRLIGPALASLHGHARHREYRLRRHARRRRRRQSAVAAAAAATSATIDVDAEASLPAIIEEVKTSDDGATSGARIAGAQREARRANQEARVEAMKQAVEGKRRAGTEARSARRASTPSCGR